MTTSIPPHICTFSRIPYFLSLVNIALISVSGYNDIISGRKRTYTLRPHLQQRGLNTLFDKEKLLARSENNSYLLLNHIQVKDIKEDWALAELHVHSDSLNPLGLVHGGNLFALADTVGGAAARSDGRNYVTQSSSFTFLHSGLLGDMIRGEAKVRRRGQVTCYVDVDVTNQKGDLLASGSFTFFHVPELPDVK